MVEIRAVKGVSKKDLPLMIARKERIIDNNYYLW
jgi:hypothetical protein